MATEIVTSKALTAIVDEVLNQLKTGTNLVTVNGGTIVDGQSIPVKRINKTVIKTVLNAVSVAADAIAIYNEEGTSTDIF